MPRFKSNNLYQTRPKIKLLLQKKGKIFERFQWLLAAGGSAPIPQSSAFPLQISGFASG